MELLSAFGGVFRAIASVYKPVIKWLARRHRFFQSKIDENEKYKFIPSNIFDIVKIGVSRDKVISLLGLPFHEANGRMTYSYSEAWLQLVLYDDGNIKTVVVGYCGDPDKQAVSIPWLSWIGADFKLGKLNFSDVMTAAGQSGKLTAFRGPRYHSLKIDIATGGPELRRSISFGNHWAIISGLTESYFDLTLEGDELATDPAEVLVNWVALSHFEFSDNWFDISPTLPVN